MKCICSLGALGLITLTWYLLGFGLAVAAAGVLLAWWLFHNLDNPNGDLDQ